MNRQTLLRIGIAAVAIALGSTCASFRSPHKGFVGELGSGLVLLIVLSMIGGLVVGGLAAVMSRPVGVEDTAWLEVLLRRAARAQLDPRASHFAGGWLCRTQANWFGPWNQVALLAAVTADLQDIG